MTKTYYKSIHTKFSNVSSTSRRSFLLATPIHFVLSSFLHRSLLRRVTKGKLPPQSNGKPRILRYAHVYVRMIDTFDSRCCSLGFGESTVTFLFLFGLNSSGSPVTSSTLDARSMPPLLSINLLENETKTSMSCLHGVCQQLNRVRRRRTGHLRTFSKRNILCVFHALELCVCVCVNNTIDLKALRVCHNKFLIKFTSRPHRKEGPTQPNRIHSVITFDPLILPNTTSNYLITRTH